MTKNTYLRIIKCAHKKYKDFICLYGTIYKRWSDFMNTTGTFEKNDIYTCARCGKIFQYSGIGLRLCQACKEIDAKEFELVKDYIYENLAATVQDTAIATGVRVRRIKEFLRDGRLLIPDNSVIFINCESCGASIKCGRLCRECANALSGEKKKEMEIEEYNIGERPKKVEARMRFLENDRRS